MVSTQLQEASWSKIARATVGPTAIHDLPIIFVSPGISREAHLAERPSRDSRGQKAPRRRCCRRATIVAPAVYATRRGSVMAIEIEVVQGDITEADVDAIVNAANDQLWMGTGVAGAIVRRGGRGIEDEAIAQGPISVGEAVITSGGVLPARHVIHAAAMGRDLQTDSDKIAKATQSALALADAHNLRSLALPALGTGVGRFPLQECARIMVAAVRGHESASLRTVRFVLLNDSACRAFQRAVPD